MAKKIILSDDGVTWCEAGEIITVTENGYQALLDGYDISELSADDILDTETIDMDIT